MKIFEKGFLIVKKKIFKLFLFFLSFYPLLVFAQSGEKIERIRINPDVATGGEVSKYIDSVSFIPMETTSESRFSDIVQLEISDEYYIILDKGSTALLIFTKQGKFHKKINTGKIIYQFFLNKEKKLIELEEYPETYLYDLDGKLISKTENKYKPNSFFGVLKSKLDSNHTAYYNIITKNNEGFIYELLIYDQQGNITNKFFPFPKNYKMDEMDNFGLLNFSLNYKSDSSIYYTHNYDYNVYRLSPNAIIPVYQFIFPLQNSLPAEFHKLTDTTSRLSFIQKNDRIIPRLFSFYKQGNLLIFHTGQNPYLYSTKTQHLINLNKIVSDSSSSFLPISASEVNAGFLSLFHFDGKFFYTSCSPEVLFNQMKATRKKNPKYTNELKNFFMDKKNVAGNPVLIQIHFKPNL